MLKAVAFGALLLVAAAAPSTAQDSGAGCAAIAADDQRLACYDSVFRAAGGSAPEIEPVVLESERLIPAAPSGRGLATLTIACAADGPVARFAFAGQPVSVTGDIAPMTMQVDQAATVVRTMAASEDNRSLIFSNARDTETFFDSLVGGTNLRVRVTPVRQRSLTVDFRLAPVLPEIISLRERCGF